MTSTLVILGSSLTALAVARDAHAHGLLPVIADSEPGIAFRSRWIKRVWLADADRREIMSRLARYAGSASALIATSDHWLRFLVDGRAAFAGIFPCILHPGTETLKALLSKSAFAAWCLAQSLPSPPSWNPRSGPRPDTLQFPMLVRPCESAPGCSMAGLPKAIEVRTQAELEHWTQRFTSGGIAPLVSQSLLSQPVVQYSVPFARNATSLMSFVTRKVRPHPCQCSQGTCVELTENREVEKLGRLAAERAGYYGIGEAEILHSPETGRNYLVEINARPWLQYAMAPASGHDFLGLMLDKTDQGAVPRRNGKTWINLRDDRFMTFSRSNGNAAVERVPLDAYLRSIARSNVYAVFDLHDPLPFVHTLLRR